jgi:hypothetical protein
MHILIRMCAFVDEHRNQGVQMVQGRDYMLFKIGRQTKDLGLTVDINDHLLKAIRSLHSRG